MKNQQLLIQLAESVGDFIEYWGFKSIHGRIWCLAYLASEPISTPEIVKTLGVSKGLVSIAVNELLEHELIEQVGKGEYGALTYKATEDIATVVRKVLRERELVKLSQVESRMKLLESLSPDELEKMNVSADKLSKIQSLTILHKTVLSSVVKRNYKTLEDWLSFLRKISKVLRFNSK